MLIGHLVMLQFPKSQNSLQNLLKKLRNSRVAGTRVRNSSKRTHPKFSSSILNVRVIFFRVIFGPPLMLNFSFTQMQVEPALKGGIFRKCAQVAKRTQSHINLFPDTLLQNKRLELSSQSDNLPPLPIIPPSPTPYFMNAMSPTVSGQLK